MNCEFCEKPIPEERLEAKPDATSCVPCLVKNGDVDLKKGRMVFNHKTAGEIEILSSKRFEEVNSLDPRGYGRRSPLDG